MKRFSISEKDIEKIIEKIKTGNFTEEELRNELTSTEVVLEFGREDVEKQIEIEIYIDRKNNKEYFDELVEEIMESCRRCSFDHETGEFNSTVRNLIEEEIENQNN